MPGRGGPVGAGLLEEMRREHPEAARRALPSAVLIVAQSDSALALKLAESIDDPGTLEETKAGIVADLAARDPASAQRIADALTRPAAKSRALVALATAIGGRSG